VSGVQLQGTGLALSGNGIVGKISNAIVNTTDQIVTGLTFVPALSETLSGAPITFGGTPMQLVYNGVTYPDQAGFFIAVKMAFSAPQLTAPNTAAVTTGGAYSASVANIPFNMTGSLTIRSGSATGPVVATIPLSGVGLYSAAQQGNTQGFSGRATYQFRPGSPAKFSLDTSTQGLWSGLYGTDGNLIADGATNFPAYAKVTFSDETVYTWASQTNDPRALENGAGSPGIASAYTQGASKPFSMNINFTDSQIHRVALYLLDWDTSVRVQTISIKDNATGNVIDTETLSNFHQGYYAIWNLQGNVTISVTPAINSTPAVSGVFFDPPAAITPANFILSATPVAIAAGLAGTSTVTVTPLTGDAPMVTLSTVNWPSGITGTFGANPTSSGSPVAISVGANAVPGTYSLTVKGTSGTTSANGQVALTVTNATSAGFAVTASQVTVAAGFTGSSTLTGNTAAGDADPRFSVTAAGPWPQGIVLGTTTGSSVGLTVLASVAPGQYVLPITVHSGILNADAAAEIALTVTDPPQLVSSAAFVGTDSVTQGAWNGKYGADGFVIAAGATSAPAYAAVTVTGADTFTWAGLTDDPRALQTEVSSTNGIASSYFAPTFSINVASSDSNVHHVAFYFLDWDSLGMAQNVAVIDTATGAILDQQSFSGYGAGMWASWNLQGNVTLALSTSMPAFSATCSGVFFDPLPTPQSLKTARSLKTAPRF